MQSGGDIKLSDIFPIDSATENLTINGDTTLDLNGKELNLGSYKITVANGKTFTLNDTTGGKITGSSSTLVQVGTYVKDYSGTLAKFVMNGGTLNSTATRSNITESESQGNDTDGVVQIGQHGTNADDKELKQNSTTAKYCWPTTAASFEMNGGSITSNNTSVNIIGLSTAKITDGTVTNAGGCCVCFGGDGYTAGGGTLNMEGGTLKSSTSYTIRTTGTQHGDTKINISGGNVIYNGSSSKPAIYAAAVGEVNISGTAKIYSSKVGIEIRKGTLNVEGGEIKTGTITESDGNFTVGSQTSGISYKYSGAGSSCKEGGAIVVSQHGTKKNIDVKISNGDISGYVALAVISGFDNNAFGEVDTRSSYDWFKTGHYNASMVVGELKEGGNASNADDYVVGTVKVNVTGGTFTSTSTDDGKVTPGSETGEYTIKGKNAIANLDKRVTLNLSGTKVIGGIAAATRTSGIGYNIGEGNTFSNFVYGENNDGVYSYRATC